MGITLYNEFAKKKKKKSKQYTASIKKKRNRANARARRGIKCAKFGIRAFVLAERLAPRGWDSRKPLVSFSFFFSYFPPASTYSISAKLFVLPASEKVHSPPTIPSLITACHFARRWENLDGKLCQVLHSVRSRDHRARTHTHTHAHTRPFD